jgi:biotin transporter BioY
MLVLFILGLLPMIDNYSHIFGFVFGFLLGFALMPFITFNVDDRRFKVVGVIVCLCLALVMMIILIVIFYVVPITSCTGCKYLNCVPFTEDFCDASEMHVNRVCNISDVTCH